MRFCPVCGSELTPEAVNCPICGAAVTAQSTQQPVNTELPKKAKKKKKNLGIKITAAVLAVVILAVSGLFIADNIMYKKEIEAEEYITDFPVLKTETDFVVFDEEDFPSTDYSIKVERVLYGGILKSELFKQTKIIIDDTSTDPVYHIDFEKDGEYIITLEDNTDEDENTTQADNETDSDDDKDKDAPSKVVINVTVDDDDDEAIGSVDLDSKPGDDPVEIPSDYKDTVTDSENFIEATDADFAKFQKFASGMYWLSFQGMENIEYNSKTSSAQFVVDNLIFDPFKKGYSAFYTVDEDIVWQAGDPLLKFNGAYCIPEEYVKWICENIYNVKYENLAEGEFTDSQTDYMWHYLYDGNYYHNDAPIGEPLDWAVAVTGAKLVNNRYEFTVESCANSFEEGMVFSCTKTVTAAIKEIDGERYWSIYSIENADKTEDKPENTDRPTSVDAYARDAEIYTAYLTGGELDSLTADMNKSYVVAESCIADFDGNGTYELLLVIRDEEYCGPRGYYTISAVYTITDGAVSAMGLVENFGGTGGGDNFYIKYDTKTNKHIVMKTSLGRDGVWAFDYNRTAYTVSGGQLNEYLKITTVFRSFDNTVYGSTAEQIKEEVPLSYEDNDGIYYHEINDNYVSKEEHDEAEARFIEPTDSAYQMKTGTYSNPLGI
ncbi:MAG: zinc ribbon domain-containing protein [Clostridia bacterium]|nr:zinc ribbon domain-containing protein [Clostridia bacterium]